MADSPPEWDGQHPEEQLLPYLKLLRSWGRRTRAPKSQQGVVVFRHQKGELRTILDETDE